MDTDQQTIDGRSEEWFLRQLENPQIDGAELVASLMSLRAGGHGADAESRAELLQDALVERGQRDDALKVLETRVAWAGSGVGAGTAWREQAERIIGPTWEQKTLLGESGFDRGLPISECLRRLHVLRSLRPDMLCHEKTWGLGTVKKIDYFYKRVEIDFGKKSGHELSLAYAAESLEIVGDDHILVWKLRRADELKALVENAAADVARMAIRSFGPLSPTSLQAVLVPGIVAESDWKRFWDQARKGLRDDPLVHVPSGRNESIRFLDKAVSHDDDWFSTLAREREIEKLVAGLEKLADKKKRDDLSSAQADILKDRLAYIAKGTVQGQWGLLARSRIAARTLGLESESASVPAESQLFFSSDALVETLRQLPVRGVRSFLKYLAELDAPRSIQLMARQLTRLDPGSLNEVMTFMLAAGQAEEACAALFRARIEGRIAEIGLLSWLSRNMDYADKWSLGSKAALLGLMLDALEQDASGDRLKAQNQLRERFTKAEWLKEVLPRLDATEIDKLVVRIKDSPGWSMLDRQSLLAHIVKLYPDTQRLLVARAKGKETLTRGPMTSQRSFRERQVQLEKIINIEIPRVAKDIALARSYGDLRENFEYKAAKENQTILLHRRDDLTRLLGEVKPTDFRDFPTDRAGMATGVSLQYESGTIERYYILGEWDGDQALGIISCSSRMAQALEGHLKGEKITVPSEKGEVRCTILEITGLSEAIRSWADGK